MTAETLAIRDQLLAMPNVRCANRCGWEAERYAIWGTVNNVSPCPDCGGAVELIQGAAP